MRETYSHKPVSVEHMEETRNEGHPYICQVLRDIWYLTDNEPIRYRIRVAMAAAKAMHAKLKRYADATRRN